MTYTIDDIEGQTEALVGLFENIDDLPDGGDVWRKLLPPLIERAQPASDENRVVRVAALTEGLALAAWCTIDNVEVVFEAADKLTMPENEKAQTLAERVELLGEALQLLSQWLLHSPYKAADAGVSTAVLQEVPRAALLRVRRTQ